AWVVAPWVRQPELFTGPGFFTPVVNNPLGLNKAQVVPAPVVIDREGEQPRFGVRAARAVAPPARPVVEGRGLEPPPGAPVDRAGGLHAQVVVVAGEEDRGGGEGSAAVGLFGPPVADSVRAG